MPENPITAYFSPVSSNPHRRLQARQRLSPFKRARRADESETDIPSSRKKTKTPNKILKGKKRESIPSVTRKAPLFSHWSPTQAEQPTQRAIVIKDTPPNSPVKSVSRRHTTPPSSPLPELTPSPDIEVPSFPCLSQIHHTTESVEPGKGIFSESTSPQHQRIEPELIPSSQTQILDTFFNYETATPTCTLKTPLASTSFHSYEPMVPYPESASSSQSYFTYSDRHSDSDDFIASSQTQYMSLPRDPEFELVPSSQTQDFFHPQRTGLCSSQEDGPESGSSITNLSEDCSRMFSLSEEPEFRVAASGAQIPSSQASEPARNDELTSYESLPDVVKELQGMFGDNYESYPSDFPMSLR